MVRPERNRGEKTSPRLQKRGKRSPQLHRYREKALFFYKVTPITKNGAKGLPDYIGAGQKLSPIASAFCPVLPRIL